MTALAIASMPQVRGEAVDPIPVPTIAAAREQLAQIHEPAIVLFTFRAGDNVHEEPVYNVDVANPDDAPIIRAHDLGERNGELLRYYAASQPGRRGYRFDRRSRTLQRLGNVKALADASV